MVKQEIQELNPDNNLTEESNWEEQEKKLKKQYGYRTRLRGDWNQGYIQTITENTRYYPEKLYDNYVTYLEKKGYIREDGTMKTRNEEGEEIPTLEQFSERKYEIDEIDEQNNYELGTGETLHITPPISDDEEL